MSVRRAKLASGLWLDRETLENERQTLHQAEQELLSSREKYVQLYDSAPVGYVTLNRYGAILSANLTAADMLDRERMHLIGSPLLPLLKGEGRRAFLLHLHSVLKNPAHEEIDEFWFHRSGHREALLQFISRRDRDSQECIHCAIRDVTAQRAAEKDQQLLAAIVQYSEDAIIGKSLDGQITSWNRGAENLFGYTAEEAVGKSVEILIPDDRRAEEALLLSKIRRGQAVGHFETIRRCKNGMDIAVSLTVSPIRDARGRVIGASKIARDISDRLEAERRLRTAHDELEQRVRERTAELSETNAALQAEIIAHQNAEAAVRRSEARLQAILDNSPEMIFLKDAQGRYLLYNRRFEDAFHLPPEGAIGKTDFSIFPRAEAQAAQRTDAQVFETGQAIQFELTRSRNSQAGVSIVSKFPVHDIDGKIYAVGGIITDITERRRLEGEVLRISEHEQQRIARDLHDSLGQQIAGAWFLSEILRKNLAAQSSPELPTAGKVVALLQATVSQARSLAHGLSPVSSQPNGLMVALDELATQTSRLYHHECRFICRKPVFLTNNTNATHLYRIAQEAVNNSMKHARAHAIQIGLSANANCVTLRIRDDGVGFRRGPKHALGMGLRTMRYRADLIGADFAIKDNRGGGTEIVCKLKLNHGTETNTHCREACHQTDLDR